MSAVTASLARNWTWILAGLPVVAYALCIAGNVVPTVVRTVVPIVVKQVVGH